MAFGLLQVCEYCATEKSNHEMHGTYNNKNACKECYDFLAKPLDPKQDTHRDSVVECARCASTYERSDGKTVHAFVLQPEQHARCVLLLPGNRALVTHSIDTPVMLDVFMCDNCILTLSTDKPIIGKFEKILKWN